MSDDRSSSIPADRSEDHSRTTGDPDFNDRDPADRTEHHSRTTGDPDFNDRDREENLRLGEAVGRALRARSSTVWELPPVSRIERRAAARARARAARRTLAGVAALALLAAGGLASWNALYRDGTSTVVVSSDDPDASDPDASNSDAARLDTAAADGGGPSGPSAGDDGAGGPETGAGGDSGKLADPPRAEDDQPALGEEPTPEEQSTGPVLQWTEIEPGLDDLTGIESVGDGRIIARSWTDSGTAGDSYSAARIVVTTNGTDWTEVPMPSGIIPDQIDISDDRWLVTGFEHGSDPYSRSSGRAFYSDDEGANWTELALGLPPDPVPTSPYVTEYAWATSALVSGENMVLVVSRGRHLELPELLDGRGLVPEGKTVVGWQNSHSDSIVFDLMDAPEPGSGTPLEYTYGSGPVESVSFTYDELAMTGEEREVFDNPDAGKVLILAGDGSTVELVAEHEGWAWPGAATEEGFILKVGLRETVLVSTDGRSWSELPSPGSGYSAVIDGSGGAIWQVGSDGRGALSIQRAGFAEPFRTLATFEGLHSTGGLAVGPAGLIATAVRTPGSTGAIHTGIPEGRVAKDGYELRFNEPEFSVTLWDLEAGTAVYVFDPEDMAADETPEGVREISDGDGFKVVFEDPETGAELVTFTEEDLDAILEPAAGASTGALAPGQYERPEMWVGWSADGTAWGWQLLNDAFGIDHGETWAEFAVGADFMLAQVHTVEVVQVPGSAGGPAATEASEGSGSAGVQAGYAVGGSGDPQPPRWFVARIS